ncbi:MAG: aminoacetone oxidase family FAD-binding enzyme [Firmicutes bacterium]|nr:aminoacetone oxidase family FAD-binding enzyme [Bacillota bacterium]
MKDKGIYDCIVIGGGASGLFFAAGLDRPCRGLILEKTGRVGTKLLMSGGGRCNITHDGDIKDFVKCYGEGGKLIRRVLYRYSNIRLRDFLLENGIETYGEEDGRVFPKSNKASEVLEMLINRSKRNGFDILYNSSVIHIAQLEDASGSQEKIWKVETEDKTFLAKFVVIATGGCSYPKTGSDGSMLKVIERDLGLKIVEPQPALCPLFIKDNPFKELAGLSVDVNLKIGKKSLQGPILFTHEGLSGPAAINLSLMAKSGDTMYVNYIYPLVYETALDSLKSKVMGNKKELGTIVGEYGLPKNLSRNLANRCKGSIKELAKLLTMDSLIVEQIGDFNVAMATKGGISLDEMDFSTMNIRGKNHLCLIGETVDITGFTGGYNLQFAFSSAMVAAENFQKTLAIS